MKNKTWRIVQYSMMLLFLAFGAFYIWRHWQEFSQITLINPGNALLLVLYTLVTIFLEGMVIKYLAFPLGVEIGFLEGFLLSGITGFYNTLTPFRGGIIARGMYFKSKYDFPYTKFLATLSGKFVVYYLFAALLAILSLVIRSIQGNIIEPLVILFFIAVVVVLLVITLRSTPIPLTNISLVDYVIKVINGWYTIRNNRKTIVILCLLSTIQLIFGTVTNLAVFGMFGLHVNFWDMLIIGSINSFNLIVSITPAGLGIKEAFLVIATSIFGISVADSIVAAITLRVFYTLVSTIIGAIASGILFKTLFIKFDNPSELG